MLPGLVTFAEAYAGRRQLQLRMAVRAARRSHIALRVAAKALCSAANKAAKGVGHMVTASIAHAERVGVLGARQRALRPETLIAADQARPVLPSATVVGHQASPGRRHRRPGQGIGLFASR